MSDSNDVGNQIRLLNTALSQKLDKQNALLEDLVSQLRKIVYRLNHPRAP